MTHPSGAAPTALRTLVAGVVDYAGLFPPASLDMPTAVANYATYRASDDAWMLGRFVVPAARLDEWTAAIAALTPADALAWNGAHLSVLLSGEFAHESAQVTDFNARAPFGVRIDVLEGRTPSVDAVLAMAAAVPDDVTLYCEVPHCDDPLELLQAVQRARVRAKIRTGGVTADAFPSPAEIVRFLRRCHDLDVTAKSTAGLHHPLRGDYRLTYDADAVRGTMYGFLNVFLAAAAIRAGASDSVATSILLLTDATEITSGELGMTACGVEISSGVLQTMRADGLVAFGSCSFVEPVSELRDFYSEAAP
ncbi:MAG: hypothetical protein V4813_13870 [Gemmatimonadota bacterium]